MFDLTVSIVRYNQRFEELKALVDRFSGNNLNYRIFMVDNSPVPYAATEVADLGNKVTYIFLGKNVGYGAGHNVAMQQILGNAKYHLVINPDIVFEQSILHEIYAYLENNVDVGLLMPKVLNTDGTLQRLCKLLPSPLDLFGRRFLPNISWTKKRNARYELHDFDYKSILDTPCLSGCFMFIRVSALQQAGVFDTRYFMYLEDYDLARRLSRFTRTILYPNVSIVHGHEKESYRSKKLFRIHISSAIKYFNKWGWIFDYEKSRLNKRIQEDVSKFSSYQ